MDNGVEMLTPEAVPVKESFEFETEMTGEGVYNQNRTSNRSGRYLLPTCLMVGLFAALSVWVYPRHDNFLAAQIKEEENEEKAGDTVSKYSYQEWLDATVRKRDGRMFEVVRAMHHDRDAFTEGLTFANDVLYESTGMNGQSSIRVVDPENGQTISRTMLPSHFFGEGLTYVDGKLYHLTYKKKVGFVFNATDMTEITRFSFETQTGQGWGMTYDPEEHELVVSDGSRFLFFWDPDTLEEKRRIPVVRMGLDTAHNINELEWWRGRIIANVWFEDVLLVINHKTGQVEKEYDFSTLWPHRERPKYANCFNGISISEDDDVLYVTGKYWDWTFLVRLLY